MDKTVGSRVWRHTQGSSGLPASDLGWGASSKTAPGSLSTGSPAGRIPPHGDGSMYSQANVRVESVLRPPTRALPSVIVFTEKVLREADGSVKLVAVKPHTDGKVFASWCASKPHGESREEPEEHKCSIYGAVAAICEEFENHQDGSGEPEILMGQSIVLGEIKSEILLQNENPLNRQILWQQYIERIESLSPESKVSRFCKEAGFLRIVEAGHYFVTRDAGEFQQTVACREYTLPRDDKASQPKGWIQENTRIGPVLEVTTSFQNYKYGIEIRIWSVGQDNSQSWVRISYGTIKYVIDSNQNNTEIPADPQEDQVPQTSIKVVAARSKAKAKPQQREPVDTPTIIPMHERRWIDIEPSEQTLAAYDLSKKVISLLRHNQTVQREEDGAIQFYRISSSKSFLTSEALVC